MKLGGVSVWAIENDDFSGSYCAQGMYPLLNALSEELHTVKAKSKSSRIPATTRAPEKSKKLDIPSKKGPSMLNSLSR